MSDGGKGDSRRKMSISQAEWESRWDAIFGRDLEAKKDNPIDNDKEDKYNTDIKED